MREKLRTGRHRRHRRYGLEGSHEGPAKLGSICVDTCRGFPVASLARSTFDRQWELMSRSLLPAAQLSGSANGSCRSRQCAMRSAVCMHGPLAGVTHLHNGLSSSYDCYVLCRRKRIAERTAAPSHQVPVQPAVCTCGSMDARSRMSAQSPHIQAAQDILYAQPDRVQLAATHTVDDQQDQSRQQFAEDWAPADNCRCCRCGRSQWPAAQRADVGHQLAWQLSQAAEFKGGSRQLRHRNWLPARTPRALIQALFTGAPSLPVASRYLSERRSLNCNQSRGSSGQRACHSAVYDMSSSTLMHPRRAQALCRGRRR